MSKKTKPRTIEELMRSLPEPPPEVLRRDIQKLESIGLPSLLRIRTNMPTRTVNDWLFPVVDQYRQPIVHLNKKDDKRWVQLYGAGLPQDMTRADVILGVEPYNLKYRDFAVHGKGVVLDEAQPIKGKGAWRWNITHPENNNSISFHIWFINIFLRNAQVHAIAHYLAPVNKGADPLFIELYHGKTGTRVEYLDVEILDQKSTNRLTANIADILNDFNSIINSAVQELRGRPPHAVADPESIPLWSKQYDDALLLLQSETKKHGSPRLGKYPEPTRATIIKLAFPDIDNQTAEALSKFPRISKVALRYTGWKCSGIEIDAWKSDSEYRDILRKSDSMRKHRRPGKGPSVPL
jgi:hypothetical protein